MKCLIKCALDSKWDPPTGYDPNLIIKLSRNVSSHDTSISVNFTSISGDSYISMRNGTTNLLVEGKNELYTSLKIFACKIQDGFFSKSKNKNT